MKQKKILLSIFAIVTPATAFAALYGFGPAEQWTSQQLTQQAETISANIISWGESFSTQMQNHYENMISAIAVATKQEAIAANLIADNNLKTSKQLVNAVAAQQRANEIADIVSKYSPQTGQGYKTCLIIQKNKTLDRAFENSHIAAQAYMAKLDNAPGTLVNSVTETMNNRYKEHLANFCTDTEANSDLCNKSKLPGGDTNASILFSAAKPNSLEEKAQIAYMQNVLGRPDQKISKSAGSSIAGQDYFFYKNRKDALISIPAYSLAKLKAANTINPEVGYSPNQLLDKRVNDYFGGTESEKWSKVLAGQDPRGLMVETLKIEGMQTWLDYLQLEQTQRINANLAALILLGSDKQKTQLNSVYKRIQENAVAKGVK
jgi:hypothetical protein